MVPKDVDLVCSYARRENRVMQLHNEYFRNDAEGQNKTAEWVGNIFPTP